MFFKISLAEWSLHQALQSGSMTNLDFPVKAKNDFGINAVEYVNQFFMDKATDGKYLAELKKICDDNEVASVLIMIDHEGFLADPDSHLRSKAVDNHFKWVDAAKFLGCHSIRVNCFGSGTADEMSKRCSESLRKIAEYAQPIGISVIVENHGGFSSDAKWLTNVIRNTGMANCGLLPDFGNFCVEREKGDMWDSPCVRWYDRYIGMEELMPYAKGVSAKTFDFDEDGNCVETDFKRMLSIVQKSGYTGYVGVEYEGKGLSEEEGILRTVELLERNGREM
jgi:sugar phosphate isomerase/epimerase